MNVTPQNTDPNGQVPNGSNPTGQVPTPQGQVPSGQPQGNIPIESLPQAWQDHIKELREKAASERVEFSKLKAVQKAQEEAELAKEQQRLKEQGEFEALAKQHAAKVQELEPTVEKYAKLTELLSAQIKHDIKDWPKEIKIFDPGDDAPVEDRLAWMEKSKPLIEKLTTAARQPGNGPNPKPSNDPTADDLKTQAANKLRATGKYNA